MAAVSVLGVDNVLLAVGDLDEARRFYEGCLGLTVKFSVPEHGIIGYAIGDEEPGLVVRRGDVNRAAPRSTPRLWLEVPDARAAARCLEAADVRLLGPAFAVGTGWTVEVADPWGNVVGLTDYANRPEMARAVPPGPASQGSSRPLNSETAKPRSSPVA